MKLSTLSYQYQRYSLEKAFSEASRLKLDGVEIWGARPHAYVYDMDDKRIEEIRGYAKNYGLEICCYIPENCIYPYNLCSHSAKERRETVEYFKRGLEIAKELGAPFIQITPGDPGFEGHPDTNWKHLCEGMIEVCQYGEKIGTDVVIETLTPMESLILNTADDLLRLVEAVNSPAMFGMLDFASPPTTSDSFSSYFDKLGPKMRHIHLADSDGRSSAHLVPGDGMICWDSVLTMIKRNNYDKYGSIEISPGRYGADPCLYMELFVKRLRELMQRNGMC